MYVHVLVRRVAHLWLALSIVTAATVAHAQTHAEHMQHEGHDMSHGDSEIPANREGSGTSWLPDETPMYALHGQANGWMLMGHGSLFLQYLHDEGDRGQHQTGSINWLMGMASRPAAGGHLML